MIPAPMTSWVLIPCCLRTEPSGTLGFVCLFVWLFFFLVFFLGGAVCCFLSVSLVKSDQPHLKRNITDNKLCGIHNVLNGFRNISCRFSFSECKN